MGTPQGTTAMPKNKNTLSSKDNCSNTYFPHQLDNINPQIISPLSPSYTRLIFASRDPSTIGFFEDTINLEPTNELDLTTNFSDKCSLR